MKTLLKYIAGYIAIAAIAAPVLLIFSTGKEGHPTVWNFVGLAYLSLLIAAGKILGRRNAL